MTSNLRGMRHSLQGRPTLLILASLFQLFPHASRAQAVPAAVSVPFGPDFLGYDGLWSPAQIRVGNPEQWLLVFPSTISSETWVAGPGICTDPTCASQRGGIFYRGNSTTWDELGPYELGFSALTQSTQEGTYGFDSIAISDTISAVDQIVAVVDNVEQWNGQLGMGVAQSRFDNNTNHLAFLSTLVEYNSVIPSHSYSYTAGASYKGSGVAGSLTLGGADTSRYTPNNFWFSLATGYIPTAAIKSMQLSSSARNTNWSSNPLEVFPETEAAMFTIDASTPFLWLPESVADSIASALGLSWNETLEVYVPSVNTVQDLADMGIEFTFNLATSADSSELLALKVSYDAFNLQLSYPYPGLFNSYSDEKVSYFPMRRANNTLQYTIGRAFLQEIYLIVDYERNSFSLSQALFPDGSQEPSLAQISRPNDSGWPGPAGDDTTSSGLSTGAKAGIAIAIVLSVCLIAGLVWFCCLRKKRKGSNIDDEKTQKTGLFSKFSKNPTRKSSVSTSAAELNADRSYPSEMNSDTSNSRFELSATTPVEMSAGEVAPTFFQERNNARIAQKNDPRSPVELTEPPQRGSISKNPAELRASAQSPTSPVPAYSPAEINQRHSNTPSSGNGVSSYSSRQSGMPSHGSDHIISPITGSGTDPNRSSRGNFSHSGSDSSKLLSPVSPVHARSDGQGSTRSVKPQDNPSQTQAAASPSTRASLSPLPDNNMFPRRSPSRDSRFREELMEDAGAQTPPEGRRQSKSSKADVRKTRFSWEG